MILVEWADALVIIASNFDLPLFDMAMEKYTQVRWFSPQQPFHRPSGRGLLIFVIWNLNIVIWIFDSPYINSFRYMKSLHFILFVGDFTNQIHFSSIC